MNDLYVLSARIGMDFSSFSVGTTAVMRMFTSLQNAAGVTGTHLDRLSRSLATFAAGAAITGVGVVGVSMMKRWTSAAAELQSAMMGVQLATTGTARQLEALHQQTFITANRTQFSAVDIASIEKIAATNGLNQRDVLLRVVPTLGNLAEIDQRLRGIAYTASVPAAVQTAHAFQAYPTNTAQTKSFTDLLDLFGRSQLVAGTSPEQMARLVTYLAPARSALHLSPQDIIGTAALASNVGLAGGHGGGSTVAALFRTIVPAMTTFNAAHNRALMAVEHAGHGSFFDRKGQFEGVTNMLNVVMRAMEAIPSQARRLALLQAAFQTTGARAFSLLATPGAIGRYQTIQGLLGPNGLPSTQAMQTGLNSTLQGQMATLQGNLKSISALLGAQLLPILAPVVHGFVQMTGTIVTFLRLHPAITKFIAMLTLVTTSVALIAGPFLMLAGLIGAVSVGIEVLGAGFAAIATIGLAPFLVGILAVVAGLTAITLVIMNVGKIMSVLGGAVGVIVSRFEALANLLPHFAPGHIPNAPYDPKTAHGHYIARKGAMQWIPDPPPGKGGGGAVFNISIHPGAVGPIHVHGAAHHDEEALAARVSAHVVRSLADELVHTLTSGATSAFGLSPVLGTPAPR